jgi:hypothetical protein
MTVSDIAQIEAALRVQLPSAYRAVVCDADASRLENAGLFDDATLIIERTKEQRAGFGGAPAWPQEMIYIGDQDDACPYALDVESGAVLQTDHGNLTRKPLARYESVSALVAELWTAIDEDAQRSRWWMFWKK